MELYSKIDKLIKEKQRVIIGIDGPCASGKSTLATELEEKYNATVFHMDDYFLPSEMKTTKRLNEIGGNVYYERMIDEIFSQINEDVIVYQKYNCMTESLETPESVSLGNVIIIEGSYSLRENLRKYYDLKIVTSIEKQEQLKRLENRNKRLLNRFINEWIPLENKYFEGSKIYDIADIIL